MWQNEGGNLLESQWDEVLHRRHHRRSVQAHNYRQCDLGIDIKGTYRDACFLHWDRAQTNYYKVLHCSSYDDHEAGVRRQDYVGWNCWRHALFCWSGPCLQTTEWEPQINRLRTWLYKNRSGDGTKWTFVSWLCRKFGKHGNNEEERKFSTGCWVRIRKHNCFCDDWELHLWKFHSVRFEYYRPRVQCSSQYTGHAPGEASNWKWNAWDGSLPP